MKGIEIHMNGYIDLVVEHARPRVCSLPEKPYNPRLSDDLYRLRTFSITTKGGVVNCGDSICNRRSRSNTSVNSTNSRYAIFVLHTIKKSISRRNSGPTLHNDIHVPSLRHLSTSIRNFKNDRYSRREAKDKTKSIT